MTKEQKIQRALFDKAWKSQSLQISSDNFGWEVLAYKSPATMYYKQAEPVCEFVFPSVRAARHYMDVYFPYLWAYDVVMCYDKPNCPTPFILEV